MLYLAAFVISMVLVLVLIPPFRKLAIKIDFVDKPRPDSERKIHREPIPLTAGVAIFIGFFITYFALTGVISREAVGIFIGSALILGIGLVDDWYKSQGKELASLPKLIVQVSAAVVVYSYGIAFEGFNNPFTGHYINLPEWLQLILTILWIFGVTTVINFSDGIDGLAGGLSAISGGTLFVVAITMGRGESALLAVILVGAALGYCDITSRRQGYLWEMPGQPSWGLYSGSLPWMVLSRVQPWRPYSFPSLRLAFRSSIISLWSFVECVSPSRFIRRMPPRHIIVCWQLGSIRSRRLYFSVC